MDSSNVSVSNDIFALLTTLCTIVASEPAPTVITKISRPNSDDVQILDRKSEEAPKPLGDTSTSMEVEEIPEAQEEGSLDHSREIKRKEAAKGVGYPTEIFGLHKNPDGELEVLLAFPHKRISRGKSRKRLVSCRLRKFN